MHLLNYAFKSMKRSADLFASDYTNPPELSDERFYRIYTLLTLH